MAHGADPLAQAGIDDRTTPHEVAEQRGFLTTAQRLKDAAGFRLAGYFAKPANRPRAWKASATVTELRSVSHCVTGAPSWIDLALRNELGLFNTVADACSAAQRLSTKEKASRRASVFAYCVLPRRFVAGESETCYAAGRAATGAFRVAGLRHRIPQRPDLLRMFPAVVQWHGSRDLGQ
ncbi:MAG: hypothetical protein ABI186_04935, partial [Candidatus Elarobacter sp.]